MTIPRTVLLAAALCIVSGCDRVRGLLGEDEASTGGSGDTEGSEADAPTLADEGFVVLEHDTALHRRPSPDAPAITLAFDSKTRAGRRFAAFRMVESKGGWVRVRPLDAQGGEKHCAGSWSPLHDFDVGLWVQRTDLVWVLRSGTLVRAADGATAMLATGTPLERGATEDDTARIPQLGIHAKIPGSSIGHDYEAGPLFPLPDPVAARPLDLASLRFDGDPIDMQAFTLTEQSPPRLPVHVRKEEDGKTFVGVGTRCAELRLQEPGSTDWFDDPLPRPSLPPATPTPRIGAWTVDAGAEAFWPDMDPAGTVRNTHVFDGEPTRKSDKRCFEFGAGWSRICVRADDLSRVGEAPEPTPSEPTPPEPKPTLPEPDPPEPEPTPPEPEPEPTPEPPEPEPEPTPPEPEPEPTPPKPTPPEPDPPPATGGEPKVDVYKAQITGSLERKSVVRVLKLHRRETLACYTEQLADDPSLAGSIQLVLTISPEGAVKSVKVRNDKLGNPTLRQCLIKEAKHWGFNRPAGGGLAIVKQTLKFSPG